MPAAFLRLAGYFEAGAAADTTSGSIIEGE